MSDKKPDLDTLDFSNIVSGESIQKEPTAPPPKKIPREATWIYGKELDEVTPTEMKEWARELTGREFSFSSLTTAQSKSSVVDKVVWVHSLLKVMEITNVFNKDTKTYVQ